MERMASVALAGLGSTPGMWKMAFGVGLLVAGSSCAFRALAPTNPARSSVAATPTASAQAQPVPEVELVAASVTPIAEAPPLPSAAATTDSSADPVDGPVEPVTIDVPRDKHVFVVFGEPSTDRVFVYLHGKCGDPLAFRAFARVIRPFGTFVSFEGDV